MKNLKLGLKYIAAGLLFLLSLNADSFGQTNTYNARLKNINFVSCRTLEFDIWLEWTGTNTQKFQYFQAGINFNYSGLSNGGTMTGAFVPGSSDPSLTIDQQSPNWNINPTSKQIRMLAAIASQDSSAAITPGPPGFRLGTFRIDNTADFSPGATPDFVWSFTSGSSTQTQTRVAFYLAGSAFGTDVTDQSTHYVESNPAFNINCPTFIAEKKNKDISSLTVFPNPATGKMSVSFYSRSISGVKIKIVDLTGREVLIDNFNVEPGKNTRDIFLKNISKGVYTLHVMSDDKYADAIRVLIE